MVPLLLLVPFVLVPEVVVVLVVLGMIMGLFFVRVSMTLVRRLWSFVRCVSGVSRTALLLLILIVRLLGANSGALLG